MKNSLPERGAKAFGGTEGQDLTSTLQKYIDGMLDDELERALIDTKRLIDATAAQLLVMVAELNRRQTASNEHILPTTQ